MHLQDVCLSGTGKSGHPATERVVMLTGHTWQKCWGPQGRCNLKDGLDANVKVDHLRHDILGSQLKRHLEDGLDAKVQGRQKRHDMLGVAIEAPP